MAQGDHLQDWERALLASCVETDKAPLVAQEVEWKVIWVAAIS